SRDPLATLGWAKKGTINRMNGLSRAISCHSLVASGHNSQWQLSAARAAIDCQMKICPMTREGAPKVENRVINTEAPSITQAPTDQPLRIHTTPISSKRPKARTAA